MIVKINGRIIQNDQAAQKKINNDTFTWKVEPIKEKNVSIDTRNDLAQAKQKAVKFYTKETLRKQLIKLQYHIKKHLAPVLVGANLLAAFPISAMANQYAITNAVAPAAAPAVAPATTGAVSSAALNTGIAVALSPVIHMLQELALPVGIGMSIWGLIEIIIGNPGGKNKIKYAILGYIGCFIIPFFFYQIHAGLSGIGGV